MQLVPNLLDTRTHVYQMFPELAVSYRTFCDDRHVYICSKQYGDHQPHVTMEPLKSSSCDYETDFKFYSHQLIYNLNGHMWLLAVTLDSTDLETSVSGNTLQKMLQQHQQLGKLSEAGKAKGSRVKQIKDMRVFAQGTKIVNN